MKIKHAKQLYYSSEQSFRDMALEYFTKEQLEQVLLPESWEELSSEQLTMSERIKASLTDLVKIKALLNIYNGKWVADWNNGEPKFTITLFRGDILTDGTNRHYPCTLAFQSADKMIHFKKHHLKLIKQAAPILWGVSFDGVEEVKEVKATGFLIKVAPDFEIFEGVLFESSDIEVMIGHGGWFNTMANVKKRYSAQSGKIQKITVYADNTHKLEDIDQEKETAQGSESIGWVLMDPVSNETTGLTGQNRTLQILLDQEDFFLSKRAAKCTARDSQQVKAIVPYKGGHKLIQA